MRGRSGADNDSLQLHASLKNDGSLHDAKRERFACRKALRRSAVLKRQHDIARSGIAVGDRIQHRLPLRKTELNLFGSPAEHNLHEQDRTHSREGEWDLFSNPWPSLPFPSAQDSISPEHYGRIFPSGFAVQNCEPEAMEKKPISPVTDINDQKFTRIVTVPDGVVGSDVKFSALRASPQPQDHSGTCDITTILPRKSNLNETNRNQPQAVSSTTDSVVPRETLCRLRSGSSDEEDTRVSSPWKRLELQGLGRPSSGGQRSSCSAIGNSATAPLRLKDAKGTQNSKEGCEGTSHSLRSIERVLGEMRVPPLLSEIDDGTDMSRSKGSLSRTMGDPHSNSVGFRRKRSRLVEQKEVTAPVKTPLRTPRRAAETCLKSEDAAANELHWGKTLSQAKRRAAEERTRTSISAFLDEAKAYKRAADKEMALVARSMKFLESAVCFLLASDFMSSARSQPAACKRMLEETLHLVESVFRQGLHRVQPTASQSCRLAILFLKMRAFLNHRIGSLCRVEEPTKTFSGMKKNELAEFLLTGECRNLESVRGTASLAEVQPKLSTNGTDLLDTYRNRIHRMSRAMNLWSRAEALVEISENRVFFDAVGSGSAVSSVTMPTRAFVLYVREAIHRIHVLRD